MRGGGNRIDTKLVMDRDAADEVAAMAAPYLLDVARKLGESIVANVPVHDGVVRKTYKPRAQRFSDSEVRLHPGSPFWHWLEYGSGFSPVYRPIQRGIEATGVRYEAS